MTATYCTSGWFWPRITADYHVILWLARFYASYVSLLYGQLHYVVRVHCVVIRIGPLAIVIISGCNSLCFSPLWTSYYTSTLVRLDKRDSLCWSSCHHNGPLGSSGLPWSVLQSHISQHFGELTVIVETDQTVLLDQILNLCMVRVLT